MDFASEEDMQKALELNGKKFMGQELKLDMPRSKDGAQEGKKGKNVLRKVSFFSFFLLNDICPTEEIAQTHLSRIFAY